MKCLEAGTEAEPLLLPCDGCDGGGFIAFEPCPDCGGSGRREIVGCPMRMTDETAWAAVMAADQAEHGMWPVAGGWLDQTQSALDAVQRVRVEMAELRRAAGGQEAS